jgi:CDP-diacylglycerol--glycerol-3-phosphate 3-phosphatidyltransferase
MALIGAAKSVAVNLLGKLKTTLQMVAIPFLLFDGNIGGWLDTRLYGVVLIWAAAFLTIWSMFYYLKKAVPHIRAAMK